ncbi:MAG: YaiI/YqxD family protein [Porticoccus sp.]|nr:YaiI/YqxD family protein [Porticoccus sp.]MBQ0807439.1 YaiI/YqxD family protein [Porticoccus sp.]
MHIWVDADACPNPIKEILFRAAQRCNMPLTLVANHAIRVPPSPLIKTIQVESGFDVADNYIVQRINPGDILITADIPLAAEAVEEGAEVINPRGEHYTKANIRQRLAMRNLMEELRTIGEVRGGPPSMTNTERQQFANALDRLLAK